MMDLIFQFVKDVAMANNFVEKWQTRLICRSGILKQNRISPNRTGYRHLTVHINSLNDANQSINSLLL